MSQLPLAIKLDDDAVFATFWRAGNAAAVSFLESLDGGSQGPGAWLWGQAACGKSHLLQAVAVQAGDRAVYLPLAELRAAGAGVLDGMETRDCVCLDDVDAVLGDAEWERALFSLYEAAASSGAALVVSAKGAPRQAGFAMADLESRFSRLPAFHIQALDEDGRLRALTLRARRRGLDLPEETARFLANRSRRDMASLQRLLDRLDDAALIAKRRLTIPFVKEVMKRERTR